MFTEYMYLIVKNDDNELVGKRIIFSFTIAAICWQNLASFMVITFFFQNDIINLTNKKSIDRNVVMKFFL